MSSGGDGGWVGVGALILQRLDHIEGRLDRMEGRLDRVEGRLDRVEERMVQGFDRVNERMDAVRRELDVKIESTRNWSVGLLALAVVGFLVKLFRPGS